MHPRLSLHLLLPLVLCAAACQAACAAEAQTAHRGWHHTVADAVQDVERLDVPLLMHFHASWCGPCRKMNREVLGSSALRQHLGRRLVGVKIDADEHPELLEKFGISSLPSDLVLDPDGKVLARMTGYQSPQKYLGRLARAEAAWSQEMKVRMARQRSAEPPQLHLSRQSDADGVRNLQPGDDTPAAATSKPPGERSLDHDGGTLIGLGGHSPVALFNWRRWKKGQPALKASHQGILYRFCDREELETFQTNPEKYAPQLLGCDPLVLFETDRAIAGSTRFGAYFKGRLFLFVSSATRDRFQEKPEQYSRYEHALRVEDIEGAVIRQARSR